MKKSYKKSEYNILHGFVFYDQWGNKKYVEANPKIKVKT